MTQTASGQGKTTMKRIFSWLTLAATAATAACGADQLTVPNTNTPTNSGITTNPRGGAQLLLNGIIASDRNILDDYILGVGNFGRESFNIFPTDGRSVTGWYQNFSDDAGFGAGLFGGYYGNQRNVLGLEELVQGSPLFTAGEKAATSGFARTEVALSLYYVITTRNIAGAPTRIATTPDTLFTFQSRDSVYSAITGNLDAGFANLTSAGAAFPFAYPGAQFAGFTNPTTFGQFNRAIAARVLATRGSLATGAARTAFYTSALTALNTSFITATLTTANRNLGPAHIYSVVAGDSPNALFTQTANQGFYANPNLQTAFGTDSTLDNRYAYLANAGLIVPFASNVTSAKKIVRFPLQTSPIQVITNEELYLLRAEASYFTGATGAALTIINNVRTISGLAARGAFASDADFITELLTQRTRSLVGLGHRWADTRRFGRLNTLPTSGLLFAKTANMVITQQECVVRSRQTDVALACPAFTAVDPQNPTP